MLTRWGSLFLACLVILVQGVHMSSMPFQKDLADSCCCSEREQCDCLPQDVTQESSLLRQLACSDTGAGALSHLVLFSYAIPILVQPMADHWRWPILAASCPPLEGFFLSSLFRPPTS